MDYFGFEGFVPLPGQGFGLFEAAVNPALKKLIDLYGPEGKKQDKEFIEYVQLLQKYNGDPDQVEEEVPDKELQPLLKDEEVKKLIRELRKQERAVRDAQMPAQGKGKVFDQFVTDAYQGLPAARGGRIRDLHHLAKRLKVRPTIRHAVFGADGKQTSFNLPGLREANSYDRRFMDFTEAVLGQFGAAVQLQGDALEARQYAIEAEACGQADGRISEGERSHLEGLKKPAEKKEEKKEGEKPKEEPTPRERVEDLAIVAAYLRPHYDKMLREEQQRERKKEEERIAEGRKAHAEQSRIESTPLEDKIDDLAREWWDDFNKKSAMEKVMWAGGGLMTLTMLPLMFTQFGQIAGLFGKLGGTRPIQWIARRGPIRWWLNAWRAGRPVPEWAPRTWGVSGSRPLYPGSPIQVPIENVPGPEMPMTPRPPVQKPLRFYQFWKKAFWTRPFFAVPLALIAGRYAVNKFVIDKYLADPKDKSWKDEAAKVGSDGAFLGVGTAAFYKAVAAGKVGQGAMRLFGTAGRVAMGGAVAFTGTNMIVNGILNEGLELAFGTPGLDEELGENLTSALSAGISVGIVKLAYSNPVSAAIVTGLGAGVLIGTGGKWVVNKLFHTDVDEKIEKYYWRLGDKPTAKMEKGKVVFRDEDGEKAWLLNRVVRAQKFQQEFELQPVKIGDKTYWLKDEKGEPLKVKTHSEEAFHRNMKIFEVHGEEKGSEWHLEKLTGYRDRNEKVMPKELMEKLKEKIAEVQKVVDAEKELKKGCGEKPKVEKRESRAVGGPGSPSPTAGRPASPAAYQPPHQQASGQGPANR